MKKIFLSVILLFLASVVVAVPARRSTITVTQSDGQKLRLMLMGDESMHYYLNTATGEKMMQTVKGDFVAISEKTLTNMQSTASNRKQINNKRRTARMTRRKANGTEMTGKKKGLVILVNFSDKTFKSAHTQTTFDNMFNKEGYNDNGHLGSVSDYFKAQSYSQFELDFDVVGPVTVSNSYSYYGANDSNGNDKYPATMVIEACKQADLQDINFADYDWDGDGEVDQVFIIYAGYGENYSGSDSKTIWPHEWNLGDAGSSGDGSGTLTLDGVTINTYACSCELCGTSGSTLSGIGTACHEFSHCLGFPDFYDTDYSGGRGMDAFDLMSSGSYNGPHYNGEIPAGYTAYERWCAGWLTPTELTGAKTISGMKDLGSTPEAYIIYNDGNRNEYFLLENRQSKDWFSYFQYSAAGHGLFVTHVDYDTDSWSNNTPNDKNTHQRMTWIAADGNFSSNFNADFFPGTSRVTELTNTSHTNVGGKLFNRNTDGTYYMNKTLSDISENTSDGTVSFDFVADAGSSTSGGSYTLDYSAESDLQGVKFDYAKPVTYTATDGSTWIIKANKNKGMRINNGRDASIKVPDCPEPITTIEIETSPAKVIRFDTTDYTGEGLPEGVAASESSTTPVIDLTGKNLTTGYIYTTDGATTITKIIVHYGESTPTEPTTELEGDVNHDGVVNMADVTRLLEIILKK